MPFHEYLQESFLLMALISGIPLVVASVAGFMVSLIQAAMQIQEQTVQFVVKLVACASVIALLAPWAAEELTMFIQKLFANLAYVGAG